MVLCWLMSPYAVSSPTVNEGMVKQVSNFCPDPGEPESGKRIGTDYRYRLSTPDTWRQFCLKKWMGQLWCHAVLIV